MKYWKYSLYLSILSFASLMVILFLPGNYAIFIRNITVIEAGKLFPVMWFIWVMALFAFGLNNVFADKWYINDNIQMPQIKKYLPSLLGLPALISFIWFLYSWLKYLPGFNGVVQILHSVAIGYL